MWKNADFDYLYCQGTYNGDSIERSGTFEHAGIYCLLRRAVRID